MSILTDAAPVIDDNNYVRHIHGGRRGYFGMFERPEDKAVCKSFKDMGIPLLPESEWDDIIRELEKFESTLVHLCKDMQLDHKDQNRTNYCWVNAPTHCCEIIRLVETGQKISYSPASVGAPIKNFRNNGGWGSQALEYFKTHGLNLTEDWPDNAISRSYYTDENQQKKQRHKTVEYFYLDTWQERVSCILAGIPTADGYNWWGHEVTGAHITLRDHDLIIRNSWANYGDYGFGTLSGSRKYANDSVAIVSMEPL